MSALKIMQMYPQDMNIYGDWGNVLTVHKRALWRGLDTEIIEYNPGDDFDTSVDVIIGGGGQDSGQDRVAEDLQKIAPELLAMVQDGVPMLMVCGMYQLFGHEFVTAEGHRIPGIGAIDMVTRGGPTRLIGNTTLSSADFGEVLGYENHSGQTYLGEGVQPLGSVRLGAGNNGEDGFEGARVQHVIGTYLHGSLLPKNPAIADQLLLHAVQRRDPSAHLDPLEVPFESAARESAGTRPR